MGANRGKSESPQEPPAKSTSAGLLLGARIRVVARRGYVLEGTCLDVWRLRQGGLAVKIKPDDGSAPREVTTLEPPVILGLPKSRRL